MIEKLTVSQCTNSSYCAGFNNAAGLANEQIEELSAKLKAVCDELEELQNSIPQWIDVNDRLPEIFTTDDSYCMNPDTKKPIRPLHQSLEVLVICETGKIKIGRFEWLGDSLYSKYKKWMPLPAPPINEE